MVVADLIIPTLGGGVLAQPGNVCVQAGRTCRIALANTDYRAPCQLRQKLHACAPQHGSIVEPFPIYTLLPPRARAKVCSQCAYFPSFVDSLDGSPLLCFYAVRVPCPRWPTRIRRLGVPCASEFKGVESTVHIKPRPNRRYCAVCPSV